jgi:hypothetical protein
MWRSIIPIVIDYTGPLMNRRPHCHGTFATIISFIKWMSCREGLQIVNEPKRTRGKSALQRQNAENLKQIFPEKEYWDLCPNFHIHVSVSELYIPTMGLPVMLEEMCRLILGILYINRSTTHECGNWG